MKKAMLLVLVAILMITFQAGSILAATTDDLSQQSVTKDLYSRGDTIVKIAESWIEHPYRYELPGINVVDSSHFVYQVYKEAKLPYQYMTATAWAQHPNNPPKNLIKVSTPKKGDIVIFAPGGGKMTGDAGIYVDSKRFIGVQSNGVGYASFGSYWGKVRKIVGYYRYK